MICFSSIQKHGVYGPHGFEGDVKVSHDTQMKHTVKIEEEDSSG